MTSLTKFVSISLLFLFSCDTENPQDLANDPFPDDILHYDGDNDATPLFTAGRNEVAVKFPADLLINKIGKRVDEIQFYLYDVPETCQLIIYEGIPGNIIYSADVVNQLTSNQWNTHILTEDVVIGNDDLWFSVVFTDPSDAHLIGCDSGPQVRNGAMILGPSDTSFIAFFISVNWNIRGILED